MLGTFSHRPILTAKAKMGYDSQEDSRKGVNVPSIVLEYRVCYSLIVSDSVCDPHGRPQDFFPGVGKLRGHSGNESPPAGSKGGAPVRVCGRKPPEANEKLCK